MTERSEVPDGGVPLAEAIAALRAELDRARVQAGEEHLRFRPTSIELVLEVAVTTSGKGSAGIRWWLVDANAELAREVSRTQTVKLTLEPLLLDEQGDPAAVVLIDADAQAPGPSSQSLEG